MGAGHREIHAAMKRRAPEAKYRLLYGSGSPMAPSATSASSASATPATSTAAAEIKAEATKLNKKLMQVLENQETLEGHVKLLTSFKWCHKRRLYYIFFVELYDHDSVS